MPRRSRLQPLDEYRQSLLHSFEVCARRTRFAIEAGDDVTTGWVEATGDLGTVFHAVVAEMLRTMWKHGHRYMPTEEAMVICREVYAAGDIALPTAERHTLAGLVLAFCKFPFVPSRIVALERPIRLEVQCPDGKVRILKGQPDLILSDPPYGLIIVDWKTGQGKPPRPRDAAKVITNEDTGTELAIGVEYLSERGHFQLDTYGLLAMEGRLEDGSRLMEGVQHATLRELHLRRGEERIATLQHDKALEHVLPQLAAHMMMLERAIRQGPKSRLWKPRPGRHCAKQCPVARSCPVPREMRGDGAIATQAQADVAARVFVVAGAQEDQARTQSKAWVEAGNPPGRVNESEEVRWGPDPGAWKERGGGRKFGIWPVANGNGNGA